MFKSEGKGLPTALSDWPYLHYITSLLAGYRIHYRKANDLELCYLSSISISLHMVMQFSTADEFNVIHIMHLLVTHFFFIENMIFHVKSQVAKHVFWGLLITTSHVTKLDMKWSMKWYIFKKIGWVCDLHNHECLENERKVLHQSVSAFVKLHSVDHFKL